MAWALVEKFNQAFTHSHRRQLSEVRDATEGNSSYTQLQEQVIEKLRRNEVDSSRSVQSPVVSSAQVADYK